MRVSRVVPTAVMGACLAVLSGCAPYVALYDVGLTHVERPADAQERYGEVQISRSDTSKTGRYVFEDELVHITWYVTAQRVHFSLTNKTEHSLKIIWDDGGYMDAAGQSHRIMHSGVKFLDKQNPQPPTVVVRGGKVSDIVYPTSYATYGGGAKGWSEAPLFSPVSSFCRLEIEGATKHIGEKVQVLLPLEVEGVVNEYLFVFEVADVEIAK